MNNLPHSIEAEQMLLGCILFDESCFINLIGIIKDCYFYRKEHQCIFYHMLLLHDKKMNIDAITLNNSLNLTHELDFVGGIDYINNLVDAIQIIGNLESYARIIYETYILRELIQVSSEIAEQAYNPHGMDINLILDNCEQKIFKIKNINFNNKQFSDFKNLLYEVIGDTLNRVSNHDSTNLLGVSTYYYELDKYLFGLQNGQLIIIAGRPGMGKTAFALNIAENIAINKQLPVAIFSLEMTEKQLVTRLISSKSGICANDIMRGTINYTESNRLQETLEILKDAPINIIESSGINALDVRSKARRFKNKMGNLSLIVIDYVQIMSSVTNNRNYNNAQEIAEISRSLKSLALELNVPIILLSQLNREVENRQDKRPNIADLRASGALEQDADVILLLYRDNYYNSNNYSNIAEINIAKNRNGSTGVIELEFNAKCTRFDNPTNLMLHNYENI